MMKSRALQLSVAKRGTIQPSAMAACWCETPLKWHALMWEGLARQGNQVSLHTRGLVPNLEVRVGLVQAGY